MKGLALIAVLAVLALKPVFPSEDANHNISLVVMAPFPDGELTKGWMRGPSLYPAAVIAAREVNNRSDILPGFNLKLIKVDSGCSAVSKVAISFLRDIYENKYHQVVGIIGPGCTAAALRVSSLTKRSEVSLIHVTPTATSPELEDPDRNTTYATISSALSYVASFIELMTHNKWNIIATLQDEGRTYFKQTHSKFMDSIDNSRRDVDVVFTGSILRGEESVIPLDGLQSSQARVVIVFAGEDVAAQLMCYAFHRHMLYPNYQWIFHDRTRENLVKNVTMFKVSGKGVNCTESEMKEATQGVILNQFYLEQANSNKTLALFQRTYNDYYEDYLKELNDTEDPIDYANSYHDAVWAMALALHNASTNGVDLTSYTYNRNSDTKLIAQYLSQVQFDGTSGPISFRNETRSVETVINITQLWDGEERLLGTYDRSMNNTLKISNRDAKFIEDTYQIKQGVHSALGALVVLLTMTLFVVTSLLHLAHIIWCDYRSIKATSPNISHLMFSGCYLFLTFLIFYTVHESFGPLSKVPFSVLCNAMIWCLICGYSLIFGTLCAKVWRVSRLFKPFRKANSGILLTDNALVVLVVLILSVDLIISVAWNVSDPLMRHAERIDRSENVYTCNCTNWSAWIGGIGVYKGTIIILLVCISVKNRRIKMKNFQHTKNVTILIYSVTLMGGVGFPLYFLFSQESAYIGFMLISTMLLCTVTLCCSTIFFPPVLVVLRGKVKERLAYRRKKHSTISFAVSSVTHML